MDRFLMMKVYVAVAEEQGFAAAARRLHMSPPAVTRSISALEAHLGVKLLQRTTRFVRTTEAGARYLEDARRILAEVDVADDMAVGINSEPRGHLAITAPVLFGRKFVTPGIVDYLQRYPDAQVSAMFVDRVVNLLEEGLDVGVRIGRLPDSSMRALPVGKVRMVLCASPEYLQRQGIPEQPQDLHDHSVISSRATNILDWRFNMQGRERDISLKVRFNVNTNDAAIEAAIRGFGITRLLSYQVADHLHSGELQTMLETWEPDPFPIHIIHREDRYGAVKVRAFIDLMKERLRSDPMLN